MAVYDLEEQDQLEDLKAWWTHWGNYVTTLAIAVCIGLVAVQGWRWWQHGQAEQASVLFQAVTGAARANDPVKAKEAMAELSAKYSGTSYAPRAGLILAKMMFDNGDKAGALAQLQWVIEKASDDNVRELARYRLAGVQFDELKYDDALRTLDAKTDDAYAGLYADLRGDILAAAGRPAEARTAYQSAVAKLDAKSPYRVYVQVKLDALGGPVAPASSAAPASPAGPTVGTAIAPTAAPGTAAPAAAPTPPAPAAAPTPPAPAAPAAPAKK